MKLHIERTTDTEATLEFVAAKQELDTVKTKVLKRLAKSVKVAGFRAGNVPAEVAEKNIDPQMLQSEFLDEAVNKLYVAALKKENIRPVGRPELNVTKFVPYATLEFTLKVPVVGEMKLADYKKTTVKKQPVKITAAEIDEVITNLQTRAAEKSDVKRAAKSGDEAWINFSGVDAKGEPVDGATGEDYPLALGSNTFIPGFEDNVIGMKIGEEKTFDVTFPKDYGKKDLQNQKVTFTVKLTNVKEVVLPTVDDAFAGKIGPFKSVDELKDAIKQQLTSEADQRVQRDYEAALVDAISEKTKVAIPDSLVSEQQEMVLQEVRQNAAQRGLSYEDFLAQSNQTEEQFIESEARPEAERRIKAGLVLSEIADKEGIDVTPEELEARIQMLKGQYKDSKMHEELDKPENRREINARLRSEKVVAFLVNQK